MEGTGFGVADGDGEGDPVGFGDAFGVGHAVGFGDAFGVNSDAPDRGSRRITSVVRSGRWIRTDAGCAAGSCHTDLGAGAGVRTTCRSERGAGTPTWCSRWCATRWTGSGR